MKKLNKFFAVLVALAMMAMLCVSTAFAEQSAALEEALENARIKKTFIIPEGVKDPTIVATFTFEGKDAKSSGLQAGESVPAANSVQFTYTGTGNQRTAPAEDVQYKALPTPTFTHAGVYVYEVSETSAVVSGTDDTDYDVQKTGGPYTVRYYVENDGNGGTTVKYITVESEDGKVESFIDEDNSEDWTNGDDSNFAFKNVYTVKDGTDDPDPDDPDGPHITPSEAALKVSKTVTAVEGQTKPATSESFPFTITITPAAGQEATTLKAWIVDSATGAVVNNAATPDVTITGANSADFVLKDGQTLAFANAPAGTRWTVEETLGGAAKWNAYTPKYGVTSAGSTIAGTQVTKDAGAGLSLKTEGETTPQTYLLAANKNDGAAYTNKYDNSINTPTGILISNLPYIALALVAIGGLVAYVVVRRRNADEA